MSGIANSLAWILLTFASFTTCRSPYRIVIGKTYIEENRSAVKQAQTIDTPSDSSALVEVEGVFGETEIGGQRLPVIWRLDPAVSRNYVALAESTPVEQGSWMKAKGRFFIKQFAMGQRHAKFSLRLLKVEEWQTLANLNPLRKRTQQEYSKIRSRLQAAITPAKSKLHLPQRPDWQLTVDGSAGNAIVSMRTNDLMYEAEIAFVFRITKSKLLSVYAVERFKGE